MPDPTLRVAIVGAGPAGFYTVQHLLQQRGHDVQIDMFDLLPTPFGLVRTGVAPDHPKIKAVTQLYHRLATQPEFRFFGNVEYGKHLSLQDLRDHYDQIVFAIGAQADRWLGIPGEDLVGVHSAREFVAWYNGNPDHAHDAFELDTPAAMVIGVGNVAADVARILCRVHDKLAVTDIADYALNSLDDSQVRSVYVVGRRGPVQAKFSPPEIRELGELVDAETSIPEHDFDLDEYSRQELDESGVNSELRRKYDALLELRERREPHKHRRLILRFQLSPVEILGDEQGRVRAVRLERNRLALGDDGVVRPRGTGVFEEIEVGLVFRSVGYKGEAVPELPFDVRGGVLPNQAGRVYDPSDSQAVRGVYAAGWIKRGPSGLIGSNKACAKETVDTMLADLAAGTVDLAPLRDPEDIDRLLEQRGLRFVTYQDWIAIDAAEVAAGAGQGRPRVKFTERDDFLRIASHGAPRQTVGS
ncbi:MAG: NADP oxidoreductase [Acidobacteria bacterium]|nr:NADP oxidoreductase [Acidobacteriota bacterium]